MNFAQAMHQLMLEREMTAKELADLSGVNAPYVSRLLSGKIKEPTWEKACAIIDALGVTVDEFKELQESE